MSAAHIFTANVVTENRETMPSIERQIQASAVTWFSISPSSASFARRLAFRCLRTRLHRWSPPELLGPLNEPCAAPQRSHHAN